MEHLGREAVEEAAARGALTAGHHGSDRPLPLVSPVYTLGLVCPCVLPNLSSFFPGHCHGWLAEGQGNIVRKKSAQRDELFSSTVSRANSLNS